MCGIIGGNWFISKEQTNIHLNKIIHRGRDASQVDVVDNFYIGHNRLSIQDLSSSANQPMWNEDRTVCKTIEKIALDFGSEYVLSFANGGDQNNNTIPERPICDQMGITLVDGLGDKIQSSSWLLKN
jgi:hypothetical protein